MSNSHDPLSVIFIKQIHLEDTIVGPISSRLSALCDALVRQGGIFKYIASSFRDVYFVEKALQLRTSNRAFIVYCFEIQL